MFTTPAAFHPEVESANIPQWQQDAASAFTLSSSQVWHHDETQTDDQVIVTSLLDEEAEVVVLGELLTDRPPAAEITELPAFSFVLSSSCHRPQCPRIGPSSIAALFLIIVFPLT